MNPKHEQVASTKIKTNNTTLLSESMRSAESRLGRGPKVRNWITQFT